MSEITLIGLGAMGSEIGRVLLEKNCDLTVWNRSPEKMDRMIDLGAKGAKTIEGAINASPRILICIDSYPATQDLLDRAEIIPLLPDKTIIQMSTGTPREAKEAESWTMEQGGNYLAVTIMVYPVSLGKPEAQFLVAGQKSVFDDCEAYINYLGGDVRYLGSNIGAAAALNLATISRLVAITIGTVHGAHICESEGVPLDQFANMFPTGDRARALIKAIHSDNFKVDGGASVDVGAGVAASIQSQASDIGINSEFPNFIMGILQRAIAAGYRDEDTAAQIKILRRDSKH